MPRLFLIWADGGYRGKLIEWVANNCLWVLEIVKRNDDVKGFVVPAATVGRGKNFFVAEPQSATVKRL